MKEGGSMFSDRYRGQTRKTIIDYHEEFEQAQTEW